MIISLILFCFFGFTLTFSQSQQTLFSPSKTRYEFETMAQVTREGGWQTVSYISYRLKLVSR